MYFSIISKIFTDEYISVIEEEDEKDSITKLENKNINSAKELNKSYNISISNNLDFLKSNDTINEAYNGNKPLSNNIISREQNPLLQNNFAFEKHNKRNELDSIFSISGSIHSIPNTPSEKEYINNSNGNSNSTKVLAKRKPTNLHKQLLLNEHLGSSSDLFDNVFNTSSTKASSSSIDSTSNKHSAFDATLVVSNRSEKQKELTNLLESNKQTKNINNDDFDLLELMDG